MRGREPSWHGGQGCASFSENSGPCRKLGVPGVPGPFPVSTNDEDHHAFPNILGLGLGATEKNGDSKVREKQPHSIQLSANSYSCSGATCKRHGQVLGVNRRQLRMRTIFQNQDLPALELASAGLTLSVTRSSVSISSEVLGKERLCLGGRTGSSVCRVLSHKSSLFLKATLKFPMLKSHLHLHFSSNV